MSQDDSNTDPPANSRAVTRLRRIGAAAVGAFVGLIVGMLLFSWLTGDRLPALDSAGLQQARQRWGEHGPADYDLEVRLQKQRVEIHRVQVRQGEVITYLIDGHPMRRRRTFVTWSVPGMFGTIQRDVNELDQVAASPGDRRTPQLSLWAVFHPEFGYPVRYRRFQWGTDHQVEWEVTEFKTVTADG